MAKKIMQFRYVQIPDPNNKGEFIWPPELMTDNIFKNYSSISKLGIQAGPGTRFTLGSTSNDYPIEIGLTGIYELDLEDYGYINYLKFIEIKSPYSEIGEKEPVNLPLLIDIVYEGGI